MFSTAVFLLAGFVYGRFVLQFAVSLRGAVAAQSHSHHFSLGTLAPLMASSRERRWTMSWPVIAAYLRLSRQSENEQRMGTSSAALPAIRAISRFCDLLRSFFQLVLCALFV